MLKIPELAMNRSRKITTVCNGVNREWSDREDAQHFVLEAMMSTDSEEHERNECIFIQLQNGLTYCTDED